MCLSKKEQDEEIHTWHVGIFEQTIYMINSDKNKKDITNLE